MEKNIKLSTDTDVLLDAFQLEKVYGGTLIDDWMNAKGELTVEDNAILEKIYQQSFKKVGGWNEEEVKMKLISFLFYIADFEEEGKISTFYERDLSAEIDHKRLSVTCDCLVASPLGLSSPKLPYFFLQEFKRRKRTQNDPEGQMLAAMLIAQHQNNDQKPIYGAWLTGSFWEFAILQDKTYYSSYTFNTVERKDLLQIIFILRKLKELILAR
ncbi:MAG: hypothetical protein U5N85_07405 [Arcicella sp.]|nr:hypothetical protein [Arcicella sp.]